MSDSPLESAAEAARPLDTEKVPDAQNHGPASVSDPDESGSRYPYLRGIHLYNLIAALIVGMLLLGLDINVVATVSFHRSVVAVLGLLKHRCHNARPFPQSRTTLTVLRM
jgi:hypothetical protein